MKIRFKNKLESIDKIQTVLSDDVHVLNLKKVAFRYMFIYFLFFWLEIIIFCRLRKWLNFLQWKLKYTLYIYKESEKNIEKFKMQLRTIAMVIIIIIDISTIKYTFHYHYQNLSNHCEFVTIIIVDNVTSSQQQQHQTTKSSST